MKTKLVLIVLLVALATTVFVVWRRNHEPSEPRTLVLYGNVDIREVNLAFRQPGRLATMVFEEGAAVKAGDLVAELDAKPYRNALDAASADVQRVRAELEKLRQGNRVQEIAQAQEAVKQAQALFLNAES